MRMRAPSLLVLAMLAHNAAAQPTSTKKIDFARDIEPVFKARCLECHGEAKQRSGLRLDSRAAILKGGDGHGPAVIPGKSADSVLLRMVAGQVEGLRMPPKGAPLSAAQIGLLRAWIDEGAAWSAETVDVVGHWSLRPVAQVIPPRVKRDNWARTPIDQFILARLEAEGFQPSSEADRRTLLRRLSLDVLGLPPTQEEVAAAQCDPAPDWYEKTVERLLASPAYGERWARHWLDAVRFAESQGFEMNQARPNAWPYRDWVINSLNADLPYDRFIQQQLTGDMLGADAATGFLVAGPYDQVKSPDPVLTAQQRADELHDMVSTTGSIFLGLTVGCARCHSHKFDPISHQDYHALKAALAGVQHGERAWRINSDRQPVVTGRNVERFPAVEARYLRLYIEATSSGSEPCIDELEIFTTGAKPANVALASAGAKMETSGTLPGYAIHKLEHLNDGRFGNDWSWISNRPNRGLIMIELARPERIDQLVWSRDRTEPPRFHDRLPTRYDIDVSLDKKSWQTVVSRDERAADYRKVYAGRFTAPEPTQRLHRGDVMQKRELVVPGGLSSVGTKWELPANATDSERRQALATWITDPKNPLTARVMVNRLWLHHFGEGLVSTPSDFGRNGAKPSHPELLDWLAGALVERQWSLKEMHRQMVLSAVYRQVSRIEAVAMRKDAGNRLLWRFAPRRLEAETLRDAILVASGGIDRTMGGPGFDLFEPNTNYVKVYTPKSKFGPETFRRMVYQSRPRMQLDDTFGAFDCPDAGQMAPKRLRSITPLQSVNLLNSPFLLEQSRLLAERVKVEAGDDSSAQCRRAFALVFQRVPDTAEEAAAEALIKQHGLPLFCRALFNANEFVFLP